MMKVQVSHDILLVHSIIAAPEESLEMAMNSFSMDPRFSDPCRAHIHLMGLTGLEGPGGRDQRSLTAGDLRCSTGTSECRD